MKLLDFLQVVNLYLTLFEKLHDNKIRLTTWTIRLLNRMHSSFTSRCFKDIATFMNFWYLPLYLTSKMLFWNCLQV